MSRFAPEECTQGVVETLGSGQGSAHLHWGEAVGDWT